MSNLNNRPEEADKIDQLLGQWAQKLPEPPAARLAQTLAQLGQPAPAPARRLRLTVLGAMAAAVALVVTGGLLLVFNNPANAPAVVALGKLPTALPIAAATPTLLAEPSATPRALATAKALPPEEPEPTAVPGPTEPPTAQPTATATEQAAAPTPDPTIDDAPRNPVPPLKTATRPAAPAPPTVAPVVTATAAPVVTATAEPPKAAATLTLSGPITALNSDSLILNATSERILLTASTRLVANQKAVPFSTLVVGQYVTVQATRNPAGQLIAQLVTIVVKTPPRMPAEK